MTTDRLTAETITPKQIRALRNDASGIDDAQVDLCDLALVGTDDSPTTEVRIQGFLRAWRTLAEPDIARTIEAAMGRGTHDEIMSAHNRLGCMVAQRATAVHQARQRCADVINAARAEDDSAVQR